MVIARNSEINPPPYKNQKVKRPYLIEQSLLISIMMAIVFFQWPFASISRIIGVYLNSDFLINNFIGDGLAVILSLLATIIGLFSSTRRGMSASVLISTLCVFGIFTIQLTSSALNNVEDGAWGNPQDEFLRSITLLGLTLSFICLPLNFNSIAPDYLIKYIWASILFFLVGLIITILQSYGVLPNFYYQWFDGQKVPRPAGGLAHPHYYSIVTALALFPLAILRGSNKISFALCLALTMGIILAVILSTSRVGFIALLVGLLFTGRRIIGLNVSDYIIALSFFTMLSISILILFYISGLELTGLKSIWNIFFSFIGNDGVDIFRGRGGSWSVEIDYITKDVTHFLFGYGYQPYVSHNLILRQMQVTGLVGTIFYVTVITLAFYHSIKSTFYGFKSLIIAIVAQIFIASLMFPVMTSQLTLTVIMLSFVFVSLGSRGFSNN